MSIVDEVITPEETDEVEEQDNTEVFNEWFEVLASMWDAIGKPLDSKRIKIYVHELDIVPLGLLKPAVSWAIRNNGNYQTVPTISAVWSGVREAVKKSGVNISDGETVESAIEKWIDAQWGKCATEYKGVISEPEEVEA
jgi:hypothetical protein